MSKKEENNLQIVNYLEGKMSAAEETAFMLKLSDDAGLRGQYEDELLISGLLNKQDEDVMLMNIFSQADDEKTAETIAPLKKKNNTIYNLFHSYKSIAAIVLLLVAATLTYLFLKNENKQPGYIAAAVKDTSSTVAKNKLPTGNKHQSADSIFKEFYTTYTAGEADPVEVSEYYEAYKNGQYAKVISAAKADYEVMSAGNKNSAAEQYMDLYKGLAFLRSNKPDSAIEKFNSVMQANSKKSDLFYTAQWYVALAWLKKNNVAQAVIIAKDIQQSASPYKFKAAQLVQELQ